MNFSNEQIKKYLAGDELPLEIGQAIEEKMRSDEGFAELVFQKMDEQPLPNFLKKAVVQVGDAELKKKVEQQLAAAKSELAAEGFFENQNLKKEAPAPQLTVAYRNRNPNTRFQYLAAAASLVAVLAAIWFFRSSPKVAPPKEAQLSEWFPNFERDYEQKISRKLEAQIESQGIGFTGLEIYERLLRLVKQCELGNFPAAKKELVTISIEHPEIELAQFFAALCQLETGDLAAAKTNFQKIKAGEFADDAQFYLAETLLRLGEKSAAVAVLEKIDGEYKGKAQMILKDLK